MALWVSPVFAKNIKKRGLQGLYGLHRPQSGGMLQSRESGILGERVSLIHLRFGRVGALPFCGCARGRRREEIAGLCPGSAIEWSFGPVACCNGPIRHGAVVKPARDDQDSRHSITLSSDAGTRSRRSDVVAHFVRGSRLRTLSRRGGASPPARFQLSRNTATEVSLAEVCFRSGKCHQWRASRTRARTVRRWTLRVQRLPCPTAQRRPAHRRSSLFGFACGPLAQPHMPRPGTRRGVLGGGGLVPE